MPYQPPTWGLKAYRGAVLALLATITYFVSPLYADADTTSYNASAAKQIATSTYDRVRKLQDTAEGTDAVVRSLADLIPDACRRGR